MTRKIIEAEIGGQKVQVRKDYYLGLWNLRYEDGMKYAGPYKTKREAAERLKEFAEQRKP